MKSTIYMLYQAFATLEELKRRSLTMKKCSIVALLGAMIVGGFAALMALILFVHTEYQRRAGTSINRSGGVNFMEYGGNRGEL